jgi:hypothetical protein
MKIKDAIGIFGLFGYMYLIGAMGIWLAKLTNSSVIIICLFFILGLIFSIIWFKRIHKFFYGNIKLAILIALAPWLFLVYLVNFIG